MVAAGLRDGVFDADLQGLLGRVYGVLFLSRKVRLGQIFKPVGALSDVIILDIVRKHFIWLGRNLFILSQVGGDELLRVDVPRCLLLGRYVLSPCLAFLVVNELLLCECRRDVVFLLNLGQIQVVLISS